MEATAETYSELQTAFSFFNEKLFANELPDCVLTYQRIKSTYGYHSGKRWTNKEGSITDEIALNPSYFATRKTIDTLSTLVHEMVHLWQEHFGKPGRGRYHNKEWAFKMNSVGLSPFNIENENRETGDRVSHKIISGGKFEVEAKKLINAGFELSWLDRYAENYNFKDADRIDAENDDDEVNNKIDIIKGGEDDIPKEIKSGGARTKYSCPNNHYSVWGKKNINPKCGECDEFMIFEEN